LDNRWFGTPRWRSVISTYKADNPANYEQSMGRWSSRLAPLLVQFATIEEATSILDVGCGTGSLSFALSRAFPDSSITGIDYSKAFVDHARSKAVNRKLYFERGDAAALPYGDAQFDAALSLLVLNFISQAEKAAREMKRVTKPGGVLAAAVWDFKGGLTFLRVLADTAAVLDAGGEAFRAKQFSAPLTGPGELVATWSSMGLKHVAHTSLTTRMEFQSFADYWTPWLGGQGTVGTYIAGLDSRTRGLLESHLRRAYLCGDDDGPRSFAATAWAVRGVV
jgi:SAM-dependent methyltransferase